MIEDRAGRPLGDWRPSQVGFVRNDLRETREPLSRIGILIGAETRDIRCEENRIEGFAVAISDLRKKA